MFYSKYINFLIAWIYSSLHHTPPFHSLYTAPFSHSPQNPLSHFPLFHTISFCKNSLPKFSQIFYKPFKHPLPPLFYSNLYLYICTKPSFLSPSQIIYSPLFLSFISVLPNPASTNRTPYFAIFWVFINLSLHFQESTLLFSWFLQN